MHITLAPVSRSAIVWMGYPSQLDSSAPISIDHIDQCTDMEIQLHRLLCPSATKLQGMKHSLRARPHSPTVSAHAHLLDIQIMFAHTHPPDMQIVGAPARSHDMHLMQTTAPSLL